MVDFSALEELLRRVGGEKRRIPLRVSEREDLGKVFDDMEREGFAVLTADQLDQVEAVKGGLLSLNGKQIILYIYQPHLDINQIRLGEGPRFHLVDCGTLQGMRRVGRFDRYVALARPEDDFPIEPLISLAFEKWGEETRENLLPCQHCLLALGLDRSYAAVRSFDRAAFFRERGNIFLPSPRFSRHTYPGGGRPSNWSEISYDLRQAANWTCDQCGVVCKDHRILLHAHHINGIPADCRPANLRALCVFCHSRQGYHYRLHCRDEDKKTIFRLRKEQGLADDDDRGLPSPPGGRRSAYARSSLWTPRR